MRELRRVYCGIGVALLVVSRVLVGQEAQATGPTVAFDLPAGDFAQTIREFGRQANIKVWYTSLNGSTEGITTQAVSGVLSASEALSRMLEGTGCTFEWETDAAVSLTVRPLGDSSVFSLDRDRAAQDALVPSDSHKEPSQEEQGEISEVRVTGSFTYLRAADAAIAPSVLLRRRDLNRTGFATAEAALDALPMNFLGGARADVGNTVTDNVAHGEAPNLRGLGAGATLVLINGRRPPASGAKGSFRDMSRVPVSVIDRIEVMPDGGSALYGSDAIAGVVNVVLRDQLEGAETQTRLATVRGGGNEVLLAQLAGKKWEGGRALFAYQFSERDALPVTERSFVWNSDKRPLGGDDFRTYRSNPGNVLDPITLLPAYAIPQNQDGRGVSPSDLQQGSVNLQNALLGQELLSERRGHSLYLTGTQTISARLEAFADVRYDRRADSQSGAADHAILSVPSTNAFYVDPFGGEPAVLVAYNFYDDLGPTLGSSDTETSFGTLGVRAELPNNWRAALAASYGRESLNWRTFNLVDQDALNSALADPNPATAFNPFSDGSHTNQSTLDTLRTNLREQAISTISYADLVADGPFLRLPAGSVNLAVGLGARREQLFQSLAGVDSQNRYERSNIFGFAELAVPLAHRLDLSLASRYEQYNDFGSAFNEKVGLSWAPTAAIKVRSSWSTSFGAPLLPDLDERNTAAGYLSLPDPHSPTGSSLVIGVQGNNAQLRQETGTSWTAGIDFVAPSPSGLIASFTYFDVDYRDRVARPGTAGALLSILAEEDRWGEPVVTRHPSRAQVEAICGVPLFFGSRNDCLEGKLPDAIVDIRLRNLASTSVAGIDAALSQSIELPRGELNWTIDGTYLLRFSEQITRTSPGANLLNTINNPLRLRARGTLEWYQHGEHLPGIGASFTTHFANGYKDNRSIPNRHIDASATFDMHLTYRTRKGSRWMEDVEIACGAVNVLDTEPPFVNTMLGYDIANADPTGRRLTFYVQKNW